MNDHLTTIRSVVAELEAIQQEIGKSQVELLNVLTDDSQDEWDAPAQAGLLKLEIVQRTIGEIQVLLVEVIPICNLGGGPARATEAPSAKTSLAVKVGSREVLASTVAADAPPTPQDWLVRKGIKIRKVAPPSGLDESADRAALLLGDRFSSISPFYEAVKRRVIENSRKRFFDTPGLTREVVKDICDFGYRLKASGFFTEFIYFSRGLARDPKKRPTIRFDLP